MNDHCTRKMWLCHGQVKIAAKSKLMNIYVSVSFSDNNASHKKCSFSRAGVTEVQLSPLYQNNFGTRGLNLDAPLKSHWWNN